MKMREAWKLHKAEHPDAEYQQWREDELEQRRAAGIDRAYQRRRREDVMLRRLPGCVQFPKR